jgi:TonB-linked SusC/RagA family outer membrane protein
MYKNFTAIICGRYSCFLSKFLLIMKLTFVLLTLALVQVQAATYAQKISISVKNASLENVLTQLRQQSGYNFLYNAQILKESKPVSLSVTDLPFKDVLNKCFLDQPLTFVINDKTVVIRERSPGETVKVAPIDITGTVIDSKGQPLPGVTVKLKGTAIATVTDMQGRYSIKIPDDKGVLVFTFIGFATQEIPVSNKRQINITLADAASNLNEVLVTGYGGTVAKRDLTGSISTVDAKQILERQPVTLEDALEGQAAGVLVANDNGDPAGTGTITIRGMGTLNSGTGPLYVIDGVINTDADFVNPADIASIEILKDAASAAIYGSRGANGVIIITTKHGQEGKPQITATYTHLFGQLAHELPTVSASQLRIFRVDKNTSVGTGGANVDSVNRYLNQDNDYQQLLFKTAEKNTYNLAISGGAKGLTYYTGLNYIDDKSIVVNSYIKRLQTTINVDYQPSDKFKVTNNLSFYYQTGNNVPLFSTIGQLYERNPWTSLYTPDGQLAGYDETKRNPLAWALLQTNLAKTYLGQYNTAINYGIVKDLRFTASFNAKLDNINGQVFNPSSLTGGTLNGGGISSGTQTTDVQFSWALQTFLNYDHTFGKYHNITGTAGFSRENFQDNSSTLGDLNYLTETVFTSNIGTLNPLTTVSTATAHATESLFGRLGYNYKSKYILTLTARRDGSSRFGPDNKWGDFFSTGAAWRFTDEPFMSWVKKFLDDGKLRYSIGQLGNDQLADYGFINQIYFGNANAISSYNGNGTAAMNLVLGNPTVKWETTTTQNFGMDLTFLKGRITFTPEYYIKNTSNLLYTANLPEESGFKTTSVNIGSIRNTGLELTLTGTVVAKKDFTWNVSANVTFQQPGIVTHLANGVPFYSIPKGATSTSTPYYITQGGRIGDFYVLHNLGVYQYDVSNAYAVNGDRLTPVGVSNNGTVAASYLDNGKPYTGTIHQVKYNGIALKGGSTIWQDVNNDGAIDANDRTIMGNAVPDSYWGLTNFFTYKHFTLNVTLNAQIGGKVYNELANLQNLNAANTTYSSPIPNEITHGWYKQGDIAIYPYVPNKDAYGDISNGINSLYLEDGTFVRLANLKLTYNLDAKLASRIKARSLAIYVYGDNLLTWTNYTGFDPEFSSTNSGSGLSPGWDTGNYPKRREVGFGINIGF